MQKIILRDGLTIHYRQAGKGPPLLLQHGWGGSSLYWQATIDYLSEFRTVYALDLPGFGQSPPMTSGKATPERLFAILVEFIEQLKLEHFDLIGHSFGCNLVSFMAAEMPDQVRRLILTCPATYRNNNERRLINIVHQAMEIGLLMRRPWIGNVPQLYRRISQRFFYRLPEDDLILKEGFLDFLRMDRRTAMESAVSAASKRVNDMLRAIRTPTLVLGTSDDQIMPRHGPATVSQLIPNSRLVWIEQCGHLPMVERPDVYHWIVRDFLFKDLPEHVGQPTYHPSLQPSLAAAAAAAVTSGPPHVVTMPTLVTTPDVPNQNNHHEQPAQQPAQQPTQSPAQPPAQPSSNEPPPAPVEVRTRNVDIDEMEEEEEEKEGRNGVQVITRLIPSPIRKQVGQITAEQIARISRQRPKSVQKRHHALPKQRAVRVSKRQLLERQAMQASGNPKQQALAASSSPEHNDQSPEYASIELAQEAAAAAKKAAEAAAKQAAEAAQRAVAAAEQALEAQHAAEAQKAALEAQEAVEKAQQVLARAFPSDGDNADNADQADQANQSAQPDNSHAAQPVQIGVANEPGRPSPSTPAQGESPTTSPAHSPGETGETARETHADQPQGGQAAAGGTSPEAATYPTAGTTETEAESANAAGTSGTPGTTNDEQQQS
jgi:pimeloyl-ACP methyl ester carboxylesterase